MLAVPMRVCQTFGRYTRREAALIALALGLVFYLVSRLGGVWLAVLALVVVVAAVGAAMLTRKWIRKGTTRLQTVVFTLPLLTALAALTVAEINKSRIRQAFLSQADIHAEYYDNGIYGSLNSLLVRCCGSSYEHVFPCDIRELNFQFNDERMAKAQRLPLSRLQHLRVLHVPPYHTITVAMIDWLNQLPTETQLHFGSTVFTEADARSLRRLRRPLENLSLFQGLLTSDELAAALTVQADNLSISSVCLGDVHEPIAQLTSSRVLRLDGMSSSLAVKLAAWKKCTKLTLSKCDLTLEDCAALAALQLEELNAGDTTEDHLQILMRSKSITSLGASIGGLSESELALVKASSPPSIKLRLAISK